MHIRPTQPHRDRPSPSSRVSRAAVHRGSRSIVTALVETPLALPRRDNSPWPRGWSNVSGEPVITNQSRSTALRRELLIFNPPLYSMKPSFLNLFMKKFTRERVVPTISANVS